MENMSYFGITSYFALFILHITLFYFEQGTDENYYDFFCITSSFYSAWSPSVQPSSTQAGELEQSKASAVGGIKAGGAAVVAAQAKITLLQSEVPRSRSITEWGSDSSCLNCQGNLLDSLDRNPIPGIPFRNTRCVYMYTGFLIFQNVVLAYV